VGNRIFVAVVVVLWLVTMSWLVVVKILPPLDQGLPPSYRGLRAGTEACWRIFWNDRPLGWAVNRVEEGSHDTRDIRARVLLSQVPLADLAPSLIASFVEGVGNISLDAKSRVELDTLGNLSGFETTLAVNDVPTIRMNGRVEKEELRLRIRAGDFEHKEHLFFPQWARLGGELTPDGRMAGMYVGRTWKMQVFSPFRPPSDPMELVEAEVVGTELIQHGGRTESARRVEFRRLDSAGVASGNDIRGIVWVAEDGRVLRQEVNVFNAKVRFERMSDDIAKRRVDLLLGPDGGPPRHRRQRSAGSGSFPSAAVGNASECRSA
jgi:hypothetical protein